MLLALLLGCPPIDTNVEALRPEITVAPEALDFGEHPVFGEAFQSVYISNGGQAPLEVELSFEGEAFSAATLSQEIPRGESWELPVQFLPVTFLTYEGTLVVTSNDEDTPEILVPLTGQGVPAPVPDVTVLPPAIDFGDVGAGSAVPGYVVVKNEGSAPLEIGTITQSGSGAFSLASDPSGGVVAAGTEIALLILYRPVNELGDHGALELPTNDPDEPTVSIPLIGNGGGDFEYPVAVIDCPDKAAPPEYVNLDGNGSFDPGGLPLSFAWSLARRPDGSQSELTSFIGHTTSFFADSAGQYEAQLVVTSDAGIPSAPAKCVIDAIPLDELHVELTWDTSRADLDLHLLRDGAKLFQLPGDVNYCNPNPGWGGSGTVDDPRLDIDDRGGYGPENVNIAVPADDRYFVKVHYYDENGDGEVEATVRIYTYGVLAQELTQSLRRNEVWDVAQLNWPAGTVGVQANPLIESSDRTCY